jgi:hypothetical protein
MFRRSTFWFVPGALVLVTGLLVALSWWRRSPRIARSLASRRLSRAVDRNLSAMDAAAAADDPHTFFAAARSALQLRLGDRFGIAPEAVTAADVAAHLGPRSGAQSIFEHADNVAYAHGRDTSHSLEQWRGIVRAELAHLEKS